MGVFKRPQGLKAAFILLRLWHDQGRALILRASSKTFFRKLWSHAPIQTPTGRGFQQACGAVPFSKHIEAPATWTSPVLRRHATLKSLSRRETRQNSQVRGSDSASATSPASHLLAR
jgi:hypothetical protein